MSHVVALCYTLLLFAWIDFIIIIFGLKVKCMKKGLNDLKNANDYEIWSKAVLSFCRCDKLQIFLIDISISFNGIASKEEKIYICLVILSKRIFSYLTYCYDYNSTQVRSHKYLNWPSLNCCPYIQPFLRVINYLRHNNKTTLEYWRWIEWKRKG